MDIFGSLPSIHFSIFPVAKAPNILCKNTHKNPLCDNAALLQTVLTLLQWQGNKSLSKFVKNKLQKKYLAKASLVNLNKIHAPPDTVFYQVVSDALYEMCCIRKDLPSVPIRSLALLWFQKTKNMKPNLDTQVFWRAWWRSVSSIRQLQRDSIFIHWFYSYDNVQRPHFGGGGGTLSLWTILNWDSWKPSDPSHWSGRWGQNLKHDFLLFETFSLDF